MEKFVKVLKRKKREEEEEKEDETQKANAKKPKTTEAGEVPEEDRPEETDEDKSGTTQKDEQQNQDLLREPGEPSDDEDEEIESDHEENKSEEKKEEEEEEDEADNSEFDVDTMEESSDEEENEEEKEKEETNVQPINNVNATGKSTNEGGSSQQPPTAPASFGGKKTGNAPSKKPTSGKYTPLFSDDDDDELENERKEREAAALKVQEEKQKEQEAQKKREEKGKQKVTEEKEKEKEAEKKEQEVDEEAGFNEWKRNVQELSGEMWEESEEIRTAKMAMAVKKKQSQSLKAIPRVLLPSDAGTSTDAEKIHPVLVLSQLPPETIYSDIVAQAIGYGEIEEEMGFCDGKQGKAIIVYKAQRDAMVARRNFPSGYREPISTMCQKEISMDHPNICYINSQDLQYDDLIDLIPYPWKWISVQKEKHSTLVNFFLRTDLDKFLKLPLKAGDGRLLMKKASFLNDKRGNDLSLWIGNLPPHWFTKNLSEYLKVKKIEAPKVHIFKDMKSNRSKRCGLVTFGNHKDLLRAYLSTWRVDGKVLDFQEPQEKEKKDESK